MTATMTEAQWAAQADGLALAYGWRVFGVLNSTREIRRRSGGTVRVRNVTPTGVGFPDRVMTRRRDRRLLFVEYKRGKRDRRGGAGGGTYELTEEQRDWLGDLSSIAAKVDAAQPYTRFPEDRRPPIEVHVWRPDDYDAMEQVLR